MTWKRFPDYWRFVRGINRSPVESPHTMASDVEICRLVDVILNRLLNRRAHCGRFDALCHSCDVTLDTCYILRFVETLGLSESAGTLMKKCINRRSYDNVCVYYIPKNKHLFAVIAVTEQYIYICAFSSAKHAAMLRVFGLQYHMHSWTSMHKFMACFSRYKVYIIDVFRVPASASH